MNAATNETHKINFHLGLDTNVYLHCQLVIIILTPEDTTIQSSNKIPGVPTR